MIQDSLRRYAPAASLLSHACAVALRGIGFADASAQYYPRGTGGFAQELLVVTVIEPGDSALVRYRVPLAKAMRSDSAAIDVTKIFSVSQRAAQQSLRRPAILLGTSALSSADSFLAPALPLRGYLASHRSAAARSWAYRTLKTDANDTNRVAATVLLANFADSDSAWWALVDGLQDQATPVRVTAMQLLHGLTTDRPRQVDWAPATASVRTVLDGTNLFAHNELLEALVATRVSPLLAPALLGTGGRLVLAKLRSTAPREHDLARRVLVQLAGRDLGDDATRWEAWVRSL
jgi:hypothetical protein